MGCRFQDHSPKYTIQNKNIPGLLMSNSQHKISSDPAPSAHLCRFDGSPLKFKESFPQEASCPQCHSNYIFHSKEILNHYYFQHDKYVLAFYLFPRDGFQLLHTSVLLNLDYLPDVNPSNAEAWLQRINNLKAFL